MTDTDVSTGIPAPTLQVIGAGFGRTGTASMREALVRLGFGPCDHMVENFEHQERFALWDEALRRKTAGEPIDWRPLLSGFQAIVDWPGAYFWEELTAAHRKPRSSSPCGIRSAGTTVFSKRFSPCETTSGPRGRGISSTPAPLAIVSVTGRIARPSLPSTLKRCARRSPRTGYWSLTSSRDGIHSAHSWASPFRKPSRFLMSMTPRRSMSLTMSMTRQCSRRRLRSDLVDPASSGLQCGAGVSRKRVSFMTPSARSARGT